MREDFLVWLEFETSWTAEDVCKKTFTTEDEVVKAVVLTSLTLKNLRGAKEEIGLMAQWLAEGCGISLLNNAC